MPRKRHNNLKGFAKGIAESIRIAVTVAISDFMKDETPELELQASLSSEERAFVHRLAKELGLRSKSRGKAANRVLTVYKRDGSSIVQDDPVFQLAPPTRKVINEMLKKFPLTSIERQELLPLTERDRLDNGDVTVRDQNKTLGRLSNGTPQVPTSATNPALLPFRQALPIWPMRDEIVETIIHNQVTVISGQTGSGKTTQVPQFLVEHYASIGKPCRIICTQPRRISAVSVSERVSVERNESIGQSVGYQIRLESRVSPRTVLTYCTDGVLLRTLMGGDSSLAAVTHVIVDEVHERNRFSDFLLISLKDALIKFGNLRLTLMSATVDTSVFTKYFNDCPVITVPGRQYDVEEFFLEDVLKKTGYIKLDKPLTKPGFEATTRSVKRAELEKWSKYVRGSPAASATTNKYGATDEVDSQKLDECISVAWMEGTDEAFKNLLDCVASGQVSVDHQHSISSITPLMVAACRGNLDVTIELLNLGANICIRASNNMTALDWACKQQQHDVVDALEVYMNETGLNDSADLELCDEADEELRDEDKELLKLYHSSFNDEHIDFDLLMVLLTQIHVNTDLSGAILIFIAGYDDIVTLRDKITGDDKVFNNTQNYLLFTLHSNMQTGDQKRVFRPSQKGVRKIILATNIAETSITIDDIVYVIDCGKVKEKSFDCMSGVCMLRSTWISQACSKQRRGRAGRTQPGICYHMFSGVRYASMQLYHTPEILRLPLHELCLHTKLLAPANTPIADFLGKAIEPPSFMVTRNAVSLLKRIDALDPWEDLTELGHHLLDLPVEPRLGKILLYSIVLKCLDPILTIVCCLAYKDPFVLPTQPGLRRACQQSRLALSSNSFSDHMALLRVFQGWQNAKGNSTERSFCDKHFASHSTLEMIQSTRTQLLGQLRASGFVQARGFKDIKCMNANSDNWAVVKAAMCAGMYPNLIRVDREHCQLRTEKECQVMFHPSSTLRDVSRLFQAVAPVITKGTIETLPTDWLIYEELSRNGRFCYARCCTLVSPVTVALFAGPSKMALEDVAEAEVAAVPIQGDDSDSEVEDVPVCDRRSVKVDNWVVFRVDAESARFASQLRQKWNALFLRRMRSPETPWSQVDEAVLKSVVQVLSIEEQTLGLQQPAGVGQRPRLTASDNIQVGSRRADDSSGHAANKLEPNRRGEQVNQHQRGPPLDGRSSVAAPRVTSYFVIKASTVDAITDSMRTQTWAFNPKTEHTLFDHHGAGELVILIFSAHGSGHFQGYARFCGVRPPVPSTEVKHRNRNRPIAIEWIKRGNLPFYTTRFMLNPYNQNLRVQSSRDGQRIESSVGEELCWLWNRMPHCNSNADQCSFPIGVRRRCKSLQPTAN